MPADPPSTFSINVSFDSARRADVVLSGDVDLAARHSLTHVVDQLAAAAPDIIVVDLAAVTFADGTLVNFLAAVRSAVPAGSVLVACRPTPPVHYVFGQSDAPAIATIQDAAFA